jgi:hypothetical protein
MNLGMNLRLLTGWLAVALIAAHIILARQGA